MQLRLSKGAAWPIGRAHARTGGAVGTLIAAASALVAAGGSALAEPERIAPSRLEIAQSSAPVTLRGGQPPAITSYDGPVAGAPDTRDAQAGPDAQAEAVLASLTAPSAAPLLIDPEEAPDLADAESDALGSGLNLAVPVRAETANHGAAFDPALGARAERLAQEARPTPPGDAYATQLLRLARLEGGALNEAYYVVDYRPVWISAEGDWAKAEGLLAALALADVHALPAARYGREALAKRLKALQARPPLAAADAEMVSETGDVAIPAAAVAAGAPAGEVGLKAKAALELDLTKAYLRFAADLSGGFIAPRALDKEFMDVEPPAADPAALLLLARDSADIPALAASLPPQTADYAALLELYAATRKIAATGGWGAPVISESTIRPLDRGAKVDMLRARLMAMGDLPADTPRETHPENGETLYDPLTEAAMKRFQARHGLAVDGVVGANTKAALNIDAAERARQVGVNLERARWMNRPLDGRRVQVNIPDFHVDLLESGASIYRSRVVVGKPEHQTPEFNDLMTDVIVNPYWHVPRSIAVEEFLPELRRDYRAMQRQNIEIFRKDGRRVNSWWVDWDDYHEDHFPFRFRQKTGPGNALGMVKFIFPNHHAVYLHDTPAKRLFSKSVRAYSHGCIRVHKPQLLAETLLAAQSRDARAQFLRLRAKEGEQATPLRKRVPVHIVYRTAWVEASRGVQLRADVYGRDAMVAEAMAAEGVAF